MDFVFYDIGNRRDKGFINRGLRKGRTFNAGFGQQVFLHRNQLLDFRMGKRDGINDDILFYFTAAAFNHND